MPVGTAGTAVHRTAPKRADRVHCPARVRVDSGEADSGRPHVSLEAGQDFSTSGCGFWQLT